MRLKDSRFYRWGLAALIAGGFMAVAAIFSPLSIAWGVTTAACGYLCILAAIYRVGNWIHTRGGIATKNEAPWTYRTNFIFMSIFGFGPAFGAISRCVVQSRPSGGVADHLSAIALIASGSLTAIAMFWVLCAFVIALGSVALSLIRKVLH